MPNPKPSEKDGNPKAAQVRIAMLRAVSVGGQRAHDLRIGPQPAYVALDRAHLNRVLVEPHTGSQLRAICEERRATRQTARAMKSSASVGVAGIITFGTEAQRLFERLTPNQQDAAYRETAEALAARLNTTLTGLAVHGDETAPHAHFQLPAYDRTGRPISETAKRDVMRDLQTITAQVMARHCPGIERGRSIAERLAAGADYADVVHKSIQMLHVSLPAEIEARRADLAAAEVALVTAQDRAAEMQARVDKLVAKENDLTAAEAKRLATYEKRLADRMAEVASAESAIEAARAEADRLSAIADAAETRREVAEVEAGALIEAAGQKAGQITQKAVAVAAAVTALAEEMTEGTLRRGDDGKIIAQHPDRLRPGLPDIKDAITAGADARAALDRDRADLAEKIRAADEERGRLVALREMIEAGLQRAEEALRSVLTLAPRVRRMLGDKTTPPSARPVWRQARADIVGAVPSLRESVKSGRDSTSAILDALRSSAPAEKPVPKGKPDRGDDGPGFGEP